VVEPAEERLHARVDRRPGDRRIHDRDEVPPGGQLVEG
jgi:hypothetical protein